MEIEIRERLKPYTHTAGTWMMLPGSDFCVQVFPTRLVVKNCYSCHIQTVDFDITGPVDHFTAEQDLEHGWIKVFGTGQSGYFCYYVDAAGEVHPEKKTIRPLAFMMERLSLGSNKAQDWDLICRRGNFTEIFPIWHRLGRLLAHTEEKGKFQRGNLQGMYSLLDQCRQSIMANAPEHIIPHFRRLFLSGFKGVFVPRLFDDDFNGIIKSDQADDRSSLALLYESAFLIHSLFFQEREKNIYLLPALPPEFHCGRLMHVSCGVEGRLHFEWTKKVVRRMTFISRQSQDLTFHFSKKKSCRLRHSNQDRGTSYISGTPIEVVADRHYWFDQFQ